MAKRSPIPSGCYGEPRKYDPTFRGPVHNRGCTDVLCCVLFTAVIFGYVALGTVAWIHGDPRKVIHPTDSTGHFCGQKNTTNMNKPILFYFNILKCASPAVLINLQCPTTQMCVSECPDHFATYADVQLQYAFDRSHWEYYRQFCKPGFNNPKKPIAHVLRDEDCPSVIVPSKPLLQRCFPDFMTRNGTLTVANRTAFKDSLDAARSVTELRDAANVITGMLEAKQLGMKIVEDYASSWAWIVIGLVIAMVISLIFILLLRFTAGFLLWFIIIAVVLLITYGIWHCYWEFTLLEEAPGSNVSLSDVGFQADLHVYLKLSQTWLIFLVSLVLTEIIVVLTLIVLRKRVRIAIGLLKEGSRAVSYVTCALFYPVVTFVLLAACISYWAVTAVFLASSGEAVYKVMSARPSCRYANHTCHPETFNRTNITQKCPGAQCLFAWYGGESVYHRHVFLLQLCNLLVFLWLVNFTMALGQCTLAGAFASYYWARRKPADIPACPVFSSFFRAVRYHTGSLAFGSLILAVVQVIRIILEYLDHRLKGSHNVLARFLLCCLKCCFWCLERFIRFMNRNAYIMIAIYGKSFCTSAREAFFLLMRNVVRVTVVDRVTDLLLLLGKLLVTGSVGLLAFFFFTHRIPFIQEEPPVLNNYWVPLLVRIWSGMTAPLQNRSSRPAGCTEFWEVLSAAPKEHGLIQNSFAVSGRWCML
ncbi:choline transporter-like protein 5-A isoform X2 [Trichomycterus rosablanca]|uniref:choline transporter-like protein 5-A isoform X2 n=1 Tax=Trichomycterus rosablanca TaxID=2290929 RepID=UPI002F353B6D